MNIDFSKYKDSFFSEAKALIKSMDAGLIELEKKPMQSKYFHQVYRSVHTLKSLSATMNYQQTVVLCHAMEDVLEYMRKNPKKISQCSDLLFKCFDFLSANIHFIETNETELDSQSLAIDLRKIASLGTEVIQTPKDIQTPIPPPVIEKIKAIEVKVERVEVLINLAEELLINKMRLDSLSAGTENSELTSAVESLGSLITELQYHVMQIRLVPIGYIFERFKRMARDLAKQQKKEINLEISGSHIEMDRLLIDEMNESISHLVRNAIDHGLETPDVRRRMEKPPQGTIKLRATQSKELVTIEISDDGSGLNIPALRVLGVDHGLVSLESTDEEVAEVIFSGFSTKEIATEVSGRGLGLSIVKQKIESIGGVIHVKSTYQKGTQFIIDIPISIAIIKALFVLSGEEIYAIPIEFVERVIIVQPDEIKGVMNNEAIILDNDNIPIIRLSQLFNSRSFAHERQPIVVIHKGDERLGLVVDSLLSTEEIVVKALSRSIKNNRYFSGAALIGSGKMVLILDILYLLKKQMHHYDVEKI